MSNNVRSFPTREAREPFDACRGVRSPEGRMPPHDLDAEAAVLSAAMLDAAALDRVTEFLDAESFFSEAHRLVFQACVALRRENAHIDVVQVATWLKNRDRIAQIGGTAYLTQLLNAAPALSPAAVTAYARTVRDHWRVRQLIATCQRVAAEGYYDYGEAQTFLDRAASKVQALAQVDGDEAIERNVDVVKRIIVQLMAARDRGSAVTGIPTGFDRFDRMTAGLHSGQLVVVGARPAMGKTSFGANIAVNVAAQNIGVLFFSLEMSRDEITKRVLASRARIDGQRLSTGILNPSEWSRLMAETQKFAETPLWLDDRPGLTSDQIRSRTMKVMRELSASGTALGLVVVDYLQRIAPTREEARLPRHEQVARASAAMKEVAKATKVPVIALAQLNREGTRGGGKARRPTMADLRESGGIEADADVIVLLHREGYYDPAKNDGTVELLLEKQRNGPTGIVVMRFEREFTRFENLAEEEGRRVWG